ncbi:hypothetical protein DPMN_128324 [Dreissena polymorpha]|uniref:Uncharacterized protein n=1 Tax=Dreissena polymorpha TaxID=45954 RepID=A0A9D4GZB1_DREPO|nr:hypothetical protein DPMN_128324 [Dreissena polymorpha]
MPSWHMQEILRQSATLPENLPYRQATRRKLLDSLRRYQDRLSSCRRLPDGARSLIDRQGTFRRIPDSLLRCEDRLVTSRILKDGLRRCQYRLGTCRRLSLTVPDSLLYRRGTCRRLPDHLQRCKDRKNTNRRFPDCLQWCQTVSQTSGVHARDSHTFCDVPRPSGKLQETSRQSVTVPDSLSVEDCLRISCRCPDGPCIVADCLEFFCRCPDGLETV